MLLVNVWLVILLFVIVCLFLFRRWRQRGEGEIGAALLARLYFLGVYVQTTISPMSSADSKALLRLGVTVWIATEALHHIVRTDFYRRVIERLTIAANGLAKKITIHRC